MRQRLLLLILTLIAGLILFLLPGSVGAPMGAIQATGVPTAIPATSTLLPSATSFPTATPTPLATPTRSPTATPTPLILPTIAPITITPISHTWLKRDTAHFQLFAMPGSAAERDLAQLALLAELSYTRAAAVIQPTKPLSVSVYFLPRVFWQGGVSHGAGDDLFISDLDRNYTAVEAWSYLIHEVTHALAANRVAPDAEIGGVLGEGLAVVASGGHYGIEPTHAWAAAISASERYIPLCQLHNDFYTAQHEIAYIEAASFVDYIIQTYGQAIFMELYHRQRPARGGHNQSQADFCAADDPMIVAPLALSNAQLEAHWRAWLAQHPPVEAERIEVFAQIRFFDLMRIYQQKLDPPAQLLPPPFREWSDTTWDAMSRPSTNPNAALYEVMLAAAHHAIQQHNPNQAVVLLDAIAVGLSDGELPDLPIVRDYKAIAQISMQSGYQLDSLELQQDQATLIAGTPQQERLQIHLIRTNQSWQIRDFQPYQPSFIIPPLPNL